MALLALLASAPIMGQVIFQSGFEESNPQNIAPGKPEFVFAVSTSTSSAKLVWLEGSDNLTPASQLIYRLHYSTQAGFVPEASNLLAEITNETSTEATGLAATTAYYFRIAVKDSDGNISSFSNEISTITASTDTQIHPSANWAKAQQDLHLGPVLSSTENSLVFSFLPESILPEVGQILIGEDELGQGYLRRVLAVGSPVGGVLTVTTEPAMLGDIVETTTIDSNLLMFDILEQPGSKIEQTAQSVTATNRMEWKDRLLIAEQTNYAPREGLPLAAQPPSSATQALDAPQALASSQDRELYVFYPSSFTTKSGMTAEFEISATVDALLDDAGEPDWDIDYFSFVEMTHPSRTSANNFGATFTESSYATSPGGLRTTRVGKISWSTTPDDADSAAYTVVFSVHATKQRCTFFCPRREVMVEVDISIDQQGRYIVTSSASEEMGVDLDFVPSLVTHLELDSNGIGLAEVYMHGTAVFDVLAYYRFEGTESINVEKPVFTRTYQSLYTAGPVPVYQEVTLSVQILFTADASIAIDANANARIEFDFDLGARYSRSGGWEDISDHTTERFLTVDLGVQGAVNAEIRLIPTVQIRFYTAAFAGFSLEPYIEGHIAAELIAEADLLKLDGYGLYRVTQLDAGLGLEGKIYAGMSVFDTKILRYPGSGSKSLFDLKYPLFSLPELSAQILNPPVISCQPTVIQGTALNGTNNPFDPASIRWATYPSDATITRNIADPYQAEFVAPAAGSYKVFFIGKGEALGNIARQFEVLELSAEQGDDTCLTLSVIKAGSGTGKVTSQPAGIDCGLACSYKFTANQLVSLTANPDTGTTFTGWTGAGCSGTGYCDVTLDVAKSVTASFESPAKLNDTGIDKGGNYPSGNNDTCTGETIAAQDCSHGRDVTHNDDSDGHAGFSFTKLDASGIDLPPLASTWSCVRDNVTGLVWENKTDDGGLQDADHTYTWYNPDPATNGGNAGAQNGGGCNGSDCDTHGYVQAVNALPQALCGFRDWRMPWREELRSIVDYSQVILSIDAAYFQFQRDYLGTWSGSPSAYDSDEAWVGIGDDRINNNRSSNLNRVRLVRSGE